MIVKRHEVIAALAAQDPGRTGTIEASATDTTLIWAFGKRVLPVLIQAEAVFWEALTHPMTPCMANLALALHQAEPSQFQFGNCGCAGQHLDLTKCDQKRGGTPCDRRIWLQQLRDRAVMPPNIETTVTITPHRAKS